MSGVKINTDLRSLVFGSSSKQLFSFATEDSATVPEESVHLDAVVEETLDLFADLLTTQKLFFPMMNMEKIPPRSSYQDHMISPFSRTQTLYAVTANHRI